jgi:hypothetical protein
MLGLLDWDQLLPLDILLTLLKLVGELHLDHIVQDYDKEFDNHLSLLVYHNLLNQILSNIFAILPSMF